MDIVSVYRKFPTEANCIAYLEQLRWHSSPVCPYCNSKKSTRIPKEHRYHCNNCNTNFSVTVQTIFHHTHVPLQKWFLAISLVLNAEKDIPARQLAKNLEVNKNTAWYLAIRINNGMIETEQRALLQCIAEIDKSYIGGKPIYED